MHHHKYIYRTASVSKTPGYIKTANGDSTGHPLALYITFERYGEHNLL
jgi:hypothetical protein